MIGCGSSLVYNGNNKNSNDMKDKIKEICNKLNREQLSVHGATEELLILFSVVGRSEQFYCHQQSPMKHNRCIEQCESCASKQ